MCCVWKFGISFTYVIESKDSNLISVCLNYDYSLIADLHIFVYRRAECASISLECAKVKVLILNNFGHNISKFLTVLKIFFLPLWLMKTLNVFLTKKSLENIILNASSSLVENMLMPLWLNRTYQVSLSLPPPPRPLTV